MRVSTSLIYDTNVATIGRQQVDLLHTQQQLSTGSRVVAPSDDPVASARALEISQSVSRINLEKENQGTASDSLKALDSQLGAIGELLTYVRERAVQAGNDALSAEDRRSIAVDVRAQFEELMSLANAKDSSGEYMFSGYKGDAQSFTGNLSGVSYQGDQGTRTLQVSSTRLIPVSVNGSELFLNIESGNGTFSTHSTSTTATISDGDVTGPVAYAGGQYGIRFSSPTTYDIFDLAADPTMSGAPLTSGAYVSGQSIGLPDPANAATQEIAIVISGTPSAGDTFNALPGASTDMFTSLQQLIVGLENTTGADYQTTIAESISRLDNALENVLRLRAQGGSRQLEVEALESVGEDMQIQYADRLDRLVGLDYVTAISDFQQQQTYLEAARSTFSKVTGLSLFNFIS
ncbi:MULTISPECIES: flagellar hook-associated protein FlgL [unclassified Uliginosibacterium]|uniref:flagellar hook-associated protein FlgL n=1 Tax=unclassified Uliginosibacterium TaxID=2621521 RepID=UPI000C7D20BB|nr:MULTISPECIES: flagellar hook-associated protein FlgL [unclassified Uliginosibacterium]MDO6385491.1 flagellar hook-associated protein FlgL [Uliginosibacterium sp. 31-12]PLK47535.1 flagellar hook-associated protein 3 [Uliginosibacterium sp. TH139]